MIDARDITVPGRLSGVGFEAHEPGLVALVGPNGSGKTTLLRVLAGLQSHAGQVSGTRPVAYLPQRLEFLSTMTVRDIVALGRVPGLGRLGRLSDADKARVEGAMAATHVFAFADRAVGTLSGGERARVGLARALAVDAPVLLVDEPTASLDASAALDIFACLRAEAEHRLVLCAVHDLALAATHADRVLIMANGALKADGGPDCLSGPLVAEVFGIVPPAQGWQTPVRVATGAP